jgi:hypothetical protein
LRCKRTAWGLEIPWRRATGRWRNQCRSSRRANPNSSEKRADVPQQVRGSVGLRSMASRCCPVLARGRSTRGPSRRELPADTKFRFFPGCVAWTDISNPLICDYQLHDAESKRGGAGLRRPGSSRRNCQIGEGVSRHPNLHFKLSRPVCLTTGRRASVTLKPAYGRFRDRPNSTDDFRFSRCVISGAVIGMERE